MLLSENLGALAEFRREAWEFQQTFETPLKKLQAFVSTIVSAGEQWRTANVTLELVVFEPQHLIALLKENSIPPSYERGVTLTAKGQKEIEALLCAVLQDWIDFVCVPEPESFAIYADHDEFTTIYAHSRSDLNRVTEVLLRKGFKPEPNYTRQL